VYLLKLFIIVYTFIDFVRRFLDDSKVILISLDIIITITIIYYLYVNKLKVRNLTKIPISIRLSLFLLFIIVFLQMYNPYYIDIKVSLVALRSYLLPIPMILIGYHFAKKKLFYQFNLIPFIVFLVILSVIYSIIQMMSDYTLIIGTAMEFIAPMEHSVHSYGDDSIQLASSFFASSKRFGHFLIIMYFLYVGLSLNYKHKINKYIFILFLSGLVLSGARESFMLFLVFNILLYIYFNKVTKIFIIFFITFIVLFLIYLNLPDNVIEKLKFLFSNIDDYINRVLMFFPNLFLNFDNENLLFGLGTGKYGQASLLNENLNQIIRVMHKVFFNIPTSCQNSITFSDAGLSKITIELGFVGMLIYIFFLISIIRIALKNIFNKYETDNLNLLLSLYIITWVIFFLKAHPVSSDIFMTYFLFFSIGYISYIERRILIK